MHIGQQSSGGCIRFSGAIEDSSMRERGGCSQGSRRAVPAGRGNKRILEHSWWTQHIKAAREEATTTLSGLAREWARSRPHHCMPVEVRDDHGPVLQRFERPKGV
ncbi:DUF6894 family protein [Bradyrhizobium yuanmingense]|uniref:DUF6894 family protein n=1 Tax=Bradyrhizobium yuanmingense TaxID=108015 RepID=UPI003D2EAFAA